MSKYKSNTSTDNHPRHITRKILVGAPLFLTLVFAFSFITMRPAPASQARSTASKQSGTTSKQSANFKPEEEAPAANVSSSSGGGSNNSKPAASNPSPAGGAPTSSPQTTGGSAPKSTTPQAPAPTGQSINPVQKIEAKGSEAVTTLTNLLH